MFFNAIWMERYDLKKNWQEGGKTLFSDSFYKCLVMLPLETNGTKIYVGGIFPNLTSKNSTCFSDWNRLNKNNDCLSHYFPKHWVSPSQYLLVKKWPPPGNNHSHEIIKGSDIYPVKKHSEITKSLYCNSNLWIYII